MKHITGSFTLVILTTAIYSPAAFAYLDPGTGSLILQGLIAAIAGSILTIKLYWKERGKQKSKVKTPAPSEPQKPA